MSDIVVKDTFGIGINAQEEITKYATFAIGGEMFGVNALNVQEIYSFQKMTKVPHSADYILGLINLRGQIVTAIDLRYRLTNKNTEITEDSMNCILKTEQGICSVIVDEIGDVMDISESNMEPPPETMDNKMKEYVSKICKLTDRLLCVLDIEKIVKVE